MNGPVITVDVSKGSCHFQPYIENGKPMCKPKVSNVRLFKDSLVKIIGDVFDCYIMIINLFGGQCQII